MPLERWQGLVVDNFKIDQPRPIPLCIVNHIACGCVAVRPWSPKFLASELMGSAEFQASCFHHSSTEGATTQVVPK
ncbi:MAG: hypothetical protein J2P56_02620, partial [Verrucomicrobia bacterium]|nr:hypothetical protein [Verrucomicrobiota bacterium]